MYMKFCEVWTWFLRCRLTDRHADLIIAMVCATSTRGELITSNHEVFACRRLLWMLKVAGPSLAQTGTCMFYNCSRNSTVGAPQNLDLHISITLLLLLHHLSLKPGLLYDTGFDNVSLHPTELSLFFWTSPADSYRKLTWWLCDKVYCRKSIFDKINIP